MHLTKTAYLSCRDTTDEVKRRTSEATRMLKTWKKCYFEVRGKIEASGRDQRWEFDRRKLFERTDYMSNICQDLYNVAQVNRKTGKKRSLATYKKGYLHRSFLISPQKHMLKFIRIMNTPTCFCGEIRKILVSKVSIYRLILTEKQL